MALSFLYAAFVRILQLLRLRRDDRDELAIEVIMLRHVEGRSYEEIDATLDLPLGTVKTYIHRARHELRDALGHLKEDSG